MPPGSPFPSRFNPLPAARLRCALCHEEAEPAALSECSRCRTRFHAECRTSSASCPSLGCPEPFAPPDPHIACPLCWRLRPDGVTRCECGADRIPLPETYASSPSLKEVVRAWLLGFSARPQAALAALELAENLATEGRLTEAEVAAEEAVRRAPWSLRARQVRAQLRIERGAPDQALDELNGALALMPEAPGPLVVRARARLRLQDLDGALADLTLALRSAPTWSAAWCERSDVWAARADLAEAERDLDEAIRLEEWSFAARSRRCSVRCDRGHLPGALEDAERSLELAPRLPLAWNNRGYARLCVGDLDGALADLDHAIGLDGACWLALTNRARVRLRGRDLPRAAADAELAARLAPDEFAPWSVLAQVHDQAGDLPAAIAAIDRARAIVGAAHFELSYHRAVIQGRRGYSDAAIGALGELIDASPRAGPCWASRAFLRLRDGQASAALEDAEVAVILAPAFDFSWVARGLARATLGQRQGAEDDFARALQTLPLDPLADRALARTELGDHEGAAQDCDAVIERAGELLAPSASAWALLRARRFLEARTLCERTAPDRSRDARLWHAMAVAREGLGDSTGGRAARDRAAQCDPDAVANWDRFFEGRA